MGGLEHRHALLDVANRGHRHVGAQRAASQFALDVLELLAHGATQQLGHHGGHVVRGVLAVELVDHQLAEHACRVLLPSALERVDDL